MARRCRLREAAREAARTAESMGVRLPDAAAGQPRRLRGWIRGSGGTGHVTRGVVTQWCHSPILPWADHPTRISVNH